MHYESNSFSLPTKKGLTADQADDLLHKNGLNAITPLPSRSNFVILLENLFSLFNCLLWLGSILCITVSFLEPDKAGKGNNVSVHYQK